VTMLVRIVVRTVIWPPPHRPAVVIVTTGPDLEGADGRSSVFRVGRPCHRVGR
jgi:hypothetical protein